MNTAIHEVAICHQVFRRLGGMEHYAIGLARAFRELGCEVTFYAREADLQLASELGINIQLSPQTHTFRKFRDWQFQRFIERQLPSLRGLQIGLSRVRVSHLSVCGGTHVGYLRATRKIPGPFSALLIQLEKKAYRGAQLVISHSDLCTGELHTFYGVPPGKVQTLYPPVETKFSPGDSRMSRQTLGLPQNRPVFLFPSMGHGRKGFDQVVRALADLNEDLVLAVAGKPVNSGYFPFVRPLGYIETMETAYRAADFTILGSLYEPFGMVGPESVLCGTRLLFDENIGCVPAIEREAVSIFNARSKASIQEAVRDALKLYRDGQHRLVNARECLRYDPDPQEHAKTLLKFGAFCRPHSPSLSVAHS